MSPLLIFSMLELNRDSSWSMVLEFSLVGRDPPFHEDGILLSTPLQVKNTSIR